MLAYFIMILPVFYHELRSFIGYAAHYIFYFSINYKNYNFLDCDWFKKLLFSTDSLAKLLSDSLLLDSWLSDSLLSDSSISQSHSKF